MRDRSPASDATGAAAPAVHAPTPGRVPATARIARMVMRTADGGVHPDAEAAVDRASSSSGAPLPDALRGRFEQSLGADLSAVRIHTGAESAAAARSVGARAYATGNDIHFAEGQYAPGDPFGVHLLAHEVAHTAQQAGASPSPQYKLEVSTPGDAAEVEADRAADAMVAGTPTTVTRAIGLARRTIQRDPDPKAAPMPGPAPQTPFDEANIPPQVQASIDQLALESLRTLTTAQIGNAKLNFYQACNDAKAGMVKKKNDREESEKMWIEIAIGVAGIALGPVGSAIGAKLAAGAAGVQPKLLDMIDTQLESRLARDGVDAQTRQAMTAQVRQRVASSRVLGLLQQVTPEKATGLVGAAASKLAGVMARIDPHGSKEEKAISYVDALMSSADASGRWRSRARRRSAASRTSIPARSTTWRRRRTDQAPRGRRREAAMRSASAPASAAAAAA